MKTIRYSLVGTSILTVLFAAVGCDKKTTSNEEAERQRREQDSRSELAEPTRPRPATPTAPTPMADDNHPKNTEPSQGAMSEHRSAVDAITTARCDREQTCDNIGSGKKYASRSECVTKVRSDWQSDLNTLECPKGIVQAKLQTCLDEIRTEGCANPIQALSRVVSCRQAEICRTTLSLAQ